MLENIDACKILPDILEIIIDSQCHKHKKYRLKYNKDWLEKYKTYNRCCFVFLCSNNDLLLYHKTIHKISLNTIYGFGRNGEYFVYWESSNQWC